MELNQKKIEIAMAAKLWGWDDLAAELGIRPDALRKMRSRTTVQPPTVGKIAQALGVRPEEIVI